MDMGQIGIGDAVGKSKDISSARYQRDTAFPIRCTYQYYRVTDLDYIDENMVKDIKEQIDQSIKYSTASGSLVVNPKGSRVTEHNHQSGKTVLDNLSVSSVLNSPLYTAPSPLYTAPSPLYTNPNPSTNNNPNSNLNNNTNPNPSPTGFPTFPQFASYPHPPTFVTRGANTSANPGVNNNTNTNITPQSDTQIQPIPAPQSTPQTEPEVVFFGSAGPFPLYEFKQPGNQLYDWCGTGKPMNK
jgi:hypothetical protein